MPSDESDSLGGADSDLVIDALFGIRTPLLVDHGQLLAAAVEVVDGTQADNLYTVSTLGRSTVEHKLIKAGAWTPRRSPLFGTQETHMAPFHIRSQFIGTLFTSNDVDAVDRYARLLTRDPSLAATEVWSLLTYSGDKPLRTPLKASGRRSRLVRTGTDIISDFNSLNTSYRYYLMTIAVPRLLPIDPFLGGRADQLVGTLDKVQQRHSIVRLRAAAGRLRKIISELSDVHAGSGRQRRADTPCASTVSDCRRSISK